MYLPSTSTLPSWFTAIRPDTSPKVQPMCRCIAVSLTIIAPLSPPQLPKASRPSETGTPEVEEEQPIVAIAATATAPPKSMMVCLVCRPSMVTPDSADIQPNCQVGPDVTFSMFVGRQTT